MGACWVLAGAWRLEDGRGRAVVAPTERAVLRGEALAVTLGR